MDYSLNEIEAYASGLGVFPLNRRDSFKWGFQLFSAWLTFGSPDND